jgi:hypothetical protein
MAAAVVRILRNNKNKRGSGASKAREVPNPIAQMERDLVAPSDVSENAKSDLPSMDDHHARRIQSMWRGVRTRVAFKRALKNTDTHLSGSAIRDALDLVFDWYEGWVKQLVIGFLLVFYLLTVWFQIFDPQPVAWASDISFLKRADLPAMSDARDEIVDANSMFPFLHTVIDAFEDAEQTASAECIEAMRPFCPQNATLFEELYQSSYDIGVEDLVQKCPQITSESGYVDATRRAVGSIYVTQTRRKSVECSDHMKEVDPFLGVSRPCLSEEEDVDFFPPPDPDCLSCEQFTAQSAIDTSAFVHVLSGKAFGWCLCFSDNYRLHCTTSNSV